MTTYDQAIDIQIDLLIIQLKNIYSNRHSIETMRTVSQSANICAASIPVAFCMINFPPAVSSINLIKTALKDKAFLYWTNLIYAECNLNIAGDMSMVAIQLQKHLK